MNRMIAILMLTAAAWLCSAIVGCTVAGRDKATIYTEETLTFADRQWDAAYHSKLADCSLKHAPSTPGAEECFGSTFDANAKVEIALRSAVAVLRSYWAARAAGKSPDYRQVAFDVSTILGGLPDEAKAIFLEHARFPLK